MTREVLHLPEPARTLLHTTFETIDGALGEIVPEGRRWRLGGGTVLAARWMHRKSTDVDIFLPANSGIAALDPRWNPRFTNAMNALGAAVAPDGVPQRLVAPALLVELGAREEHPLGIDVGEFAS